MVTLSWIALAIVVSLSLLLVLEITLCLRRNVEAVEIDLNDVDELFVGGYGQDADPGEMRRDVCC
jgi:hypothetical protein